MRCLSMVLWCVWLIVLNPSRAQESLPTLAEHIAANDDLAIFQRLLEITDPQIRAWLENPANEFTVFAPTDAAWEQYFDSMGLTAEEYMQRATNLEEKLGLHIVPMALIAQQEDEIGLAHCNLLGSMLPDTPNFIEWEIGAFQVNLEEVSSEPIAAANGLIYITDQVLSEMSLGSAGDHTPDDVATSTPAPRLPRRPLSADNDMLTTLADDGRFTILLELLAEYPQYEDKLTSDGLYMLFAPTDAVFEQYDGTEDLEESFLAYNLLPGYLTPDALDEYTRTNSQFCTFQRGEPVEFNRDSGTALIGDVPLSGEALLASNGVIYVTEGIHTVPFRG